MIARESWPALGLLVLLLVVESAINPAALVPSNWGTLLGLAAPLMAAAAAVMPAMLGGGGGIDVSIGPLIGFINAVCIAGLVVGLGVTTPLAMVPACIVLGAAVGAVNGVLATVVRVQPIIATLGSYLVLSGLTLTILPAPIGGAPDWLKALSGTASLLPLGAIVLVWTGIARTPFYGDLMATGSDARTALSAGVAVVPVRLLSYVLGGAFAGVAALLVTGLIGSADPNIGPNYTLLAISAAALGGVGLSGGRGGLAAALLGALDIFLLQNVLTAFNSSPFVLQIAYGLILVASVSLNALARRSAAAA